MKLITTANQEHLRSAQGVFKSVEEIRAVTTQNALDAGQLQATDDKPAKRSPRSAAATDAAPADEARPATRRGKRAAD